LVNLVDRGGSSICGSISICISSSKKTWAGWIFQAIMLKRSNPLLPDAHP
jgi:hypothetical protein